MNNIISMVITAVIASTACTVGTNITANPLEGRTIAFVGDSISYGTNYYGGYGKIIGEQNNMVVTNPSVGGATIAKNVKYEDNGTKIRPCIIDMVDGLEGEYDYIILEGGVNDFWNHAPLGEVSADFDGGYNEETTAGGLESMFYKIKKEHSDSKMGFVIIHDPFTYDAENGFAPYYEMLKTVCDKWEVPYIDLYARNNPETGVNVKNAEQKKLYFGSDERPEGDGCHPNERGYQFIYVEPMTEWMKSL